MSSVRCPHCHEDVPEDEFARHRRRHERGRGDDRQADDAAPPPDTRGAGGIEDEPRVYVHKKCGVKTVMPEDIVRTYLRNPHLQSYLWNLTFCSGCGKRVAFASCTWTETGENMQSYFDALRVRTPRPNGCLGVVLLALSAAAAGVAVLA